MDAPAMGRVTGSPRDSTRNAAPPRAETERKVGNMDNIILLFVCLAVGMALRKSGRLPDNAHMAINGFIIHVSLPALTLLQIHFVTLDPALFYAALMPWLLFASSALVFWAVGQALGLPKATVGALAVVGGLGNTSFMGLPMIEAFYGAPDMPIGIVIDQLGTYLALSTVGIMLICFYSEGTITGREIARRIVTFPPLIALVVAIALMPVAYPAWISSVLARLGGTLAPLALVSVGLQLRLGELPGNRASLAMGVGYKLVLGPLLILLFYAGVLGLRGTITHVTLFESAMGPQIGGAIVATQYGLNASLIALIVGVGTVLSFVTLPLWWNAFRALGLG
jgi:predicted permease